MNNQTTTTRTAPAQGQTVSTAVNSGSGNLQAVVKMNEIDSLRRFGAYCNVYGAGIKMKCLLELHTFDPVTRQRAARADSYISFRDIVALHALLAAGRFNTMQMGQVGGTPGIWEHHSGNHASSADGLMNNVIHRYLRIEWAAATATPSRPYTITIENGPGKETETGIYVADGTATNVCQMDFNEWELLRLFSSMTLYAAGVMAMYGDEQEEQRIEIRRRRIEARQRQSATTSTR